MIPEAEATGRLRGAARKLRVAQSKPTSAAAPTGVALLRSRQARAFPDGARRGRLRERRARRRACCSMSANARFPAGAREFERPGRQVSDVQLQRARATRVFEHELNEYKSVQVHAHPARLLRLATPSAASTAAAASMRASDRSRPSGRIAPRTNGADLGQRLQGSACASSRASMQVAGHGTSLPLETNNITLDPELKDAWGMPAIRVTYKDHPDDLATARFLQDRGAEILDAAGALRVTKAPVDRADVFGCTCSAPAAWATTRRSRWSTISPQPRRAESVHLRRQQPRHLGPRPADDDHPGARVPRRRTHREVSRRRNEI